MLNPGLSIIHANHLEDLRELAVEWVRAHPLAPLENEVFLVQSNGMGQWLKLRLAEDDACGIAAALDMQMPARFIWSAYRTLLGSEAVPETSPYDKERLVWRLMRMLPGCLDKTAFAPLKNFLRNDSDLRKRYQLCEHLADLFDQYQVYRADWLGLWRDGQDSLSLPGAAPLALQDDQRWQAALWRLVRDDLPAAIRDTSRADLHARFLSACRAATERPGDLPRRLILFGISSLPEQVIETLDALSHLVQIQLYVLNPCRYYWADIIEERHLLRFGRYRHADKTGLAGLDPDSLHLRVNPLLAAWGKQGRDYIGLLYQYDQASDSDAQIDLFRERAQGPDALLLQRIQQRILDLDPLPDTPEPVAPEDNSVVLHLAHSRQREVEILHDQLLDRLEAEAGGSGALQPRDIIVMVPDISAYAPHIEAVFGNLPPEDARHIPFTIADRPERAGNPLMGALEQLLALPEARFGVSELLDLLDVPAFRDRFGIDADDLPRLHRWIEDSGIRWGLDAEQRASLDLPAGLEQNSWLFGLRRMLLGYVLGEAGPWRDIEPYPEPGGLDAALAGRLAAVIETLRAGWQALAGNRDCDSWVQHIQTLIEQCLLARDSQDALQLTRFLEVLLNWQTACREARLSEALPLAVVRDALLARFDESSLSQRFLAGRVNFCTLMPMRAIPFRVVCLLGMNDGDYPRQRPPMDFDLMARHYRPGDRSRREDDRYLFLEALLSARDQLYISYIGHDEKDNSPRTPSVLVGQLCDHIAGGWCRHGDSGPDAGQRLLRGLTTVHPLQPFSPAYFRIGGPDVDPRLFTYAREWREIHEAPAPRTEETLPPLALEEPVALETLTTFFRQPAETFFRQRLRVRFRRETVASEDHEPFRLDGLAEHQLKDELVAAALAAPAEHRQRVLGDRTAALQRRGDLPVGPAGAATAVRLRTQAAEVLSHWQQVETCWPDILADPLEIALDLALPGGGNLLLEGWLDRPRTNGTGQLALTVLRPGQAFAGKQLKAHYFSPLWVPLLAANAQGRSTCGLLVCRDGIHRLDPLPAERARSLLSMMAGAFAEALRAPLPVALKTALAWLVESGEEPQGPPPTGVASAYDGNSFTGGGEVTESGALARCWPRFADLWGEPFRHWAGQLYRPFLEALENRGDSP